MSVKIAQLKKLLVFNGCVSDKISYCLIVI